MFKKLALALVLSLIGLPAAAQNVTCATRPVGDNTNACASTAFVQENMVAAGVAGVHTITNTDLSLIFSQPSGDVIGSLNTSNTTIWQVPQTFRAASNQSILVQGDLPGIGGADLGIRIQNTSSSGNSALEFWNDVGVQTGAIFSQGTTVGGHGGASSLNVGTSGNTPLSFFTQDLPRVTISGGGLITLNGITGSVQCLQVGTSGVIAGTGSPCGSAVSSVSNNDSSLTIGPTVGIVIASLNVNHANAWTALQTFNNGVTTSALTLASVIGSTQCLQVDSSGNVSGAGAACGTGSGSGNLLPANNTWTGTNTFTNTVKLNVMGSIQCLEVDNTGTVSGTGAPCGSGSGGASVLVSDTAPVGAPDNSLWWESDTGNLYIYYSDGNSTQWVNVGISGGAAGGGTNLLPLNNTWTGQNTYAPSVAGNAIAINGPSGSGFNTLDVSQTWSAPGGGNLLGSFTAYGDRAALVLRRANGQQSAPTQVKALDELGNVNFRGYTSATAFTTGTAVMRGIALEDFTSTNSGTALTFGVAPLGQTFALEMMRVTSVGLGVGSPGASVAPDALLTVNANTAASVPPLTGILHLVGADATGNGITIDNFASAPSILGRRAEGTNAAKIAMNSGPSLLTINSLGWDGAAYSQGPFIQFSTAEAWSSGTNSHGSMIKFNTVPTGAGGTVTEVMRVQPSGGLSVGSANVGTDLGNGIIRSGGVVIPNPASQIGLRIISTATASQSLGLSIIAGTNTNDYGLFVSSASSTQEFGVMGDGSVFVGNPTGGVKGYGTLNAQGLYVQGAPVAITIASGQFALNTTTVPAQSCTVTQGVGASGVLATDAVASAFNTDVTSVPGYQPLVTGMLTIFIWPSANQVNFKTCNQSTGSITPGAITLNWRVTR